MTKTERSILRRALPDDVIDSIVDFASDETRSLVLSKNERQEWEVRLCSSPGAYSYLTIARPRDRKGARIYLDHAKGHGNIDRVLIMDPIHGNLKYWIYGPRGTANSVLITYFFGEGALQALVKRLNGSCIRIPFPVLIPR